MALFIHTHRRETLSGRDLPYVGLVAKPRRLGPYTETTMTPHMLRGRLSPACSYLTWSVAPGVAVVLRHIRRKLE
jgi:hypothetical protein